MKLELKHIAPYLPYSLKFYRPFLIWTGGENPQPDHEEWGEDLITLANAEKIIDSGMPIILRPMSDLFNDNLNPVPINEMQHIHGWDYLFYNVYKKKEEFNINAVKYACLIILLENHFDVFGLIEQGLSIDKNTLTV